MSSVDIANNAARDAYARLLDCTGMTSADIGGSVSITGADPVIPSRYRPGAGAAAALAAMGAGVAAIWKQRSGQGQDVTVDVARAAVPGLKTSALIWQNGRHLDRPIGIRGKRASSFFETKDGKRLYLLLTTTYPQMMTRLMDALDCAFNVDALAKAVIKYDGLEVEELLAKHKAVGVIARTAAEWAAHPQGQWLATQAPVETASLGNSAPEPFRPGGDRPLAGLRVLDMAHVLAGPVTARLLAEQGADVLHVGSADQGDRIGQILDTGVGKRNATIDLSHPEDVEALRTLVREADVFVQSWRPGSLDRYGFGPEQVAALRPGIVYASISAYGAGGPWRERGGYEPVGQTVAGLAIAEGTAAEPKLAATSTLNDYLTPYLTAAGIMGALLRRSREGGSYHITASLTRSSMYLLEMGALTAEELKHVPAAVPDIDPAHLVEMESAFGTLRLPAPITQYSATPARWDLPPAPLGNGKPVWLPR